VVEIQDRLDDPEYRQLVGARLRDLRSQKRLCQDDVAKATGISKSKICRIERGLFRLKPRDAIAIAGALGVSLDKFLYDESEPATVVA
jgi:transcriptional regulator with XRE-family HTH domain